MFYRASDITISMDDWIQLNASQIPTEVILTLYGPYRWEPRVDGDGLVRCHPACSRCDGTGEIEVQDPDGAFDDECPDCGGTGRNEGDDGELYAWPAAHGTCWIVEHRDEVRDAAIAAGFVVYEADGGPFDGCLVLCIDGGGYSFRGQHWLPLRAALAVTQVADDAELAAFFWAWVDETASREGESLESVCRRAGVTL